MMRKTLCALVCLTGIAQSEERTVDVYQDYRFNFAEYGIRNNNCGRYLRQALARTNIQSPFCAVDDIGRFLKAGWFVQHSEDIGYTITNPPNITHQWECRLFSIECVGKRYYLVRDEDTQTTEPDEGPVLKHIQVPKG